ncbi:MAG: hypothetical protein N2509_01040 [Treponemataceae bacterium]|nr:hypothetical protein [Treponemataceae bacterium]
MMGKVRKVFQRGMVFVMVVLIGTASFAGPRGKFVVKAGEELYVCACGEKCPCETVSNNPGKCSCDAELVKAKVVKVEKNKAYFKAEGWTKERAFKMEGKYTCACPPACKCDTISQNPGKCTCGVEMRKI